MLVCGLCANTYELHHCVITRLCSPFELELMVKLRTLLTVFTLILKAKAPDYGKGHCQSLFKTSHVSRRSSLKCLSGIQVQLLSLCMGKHQILQNCSLSLRLNFIFEITNEIGQQLCHKCCFFCSNRILKSLFLRLHQPVRMRSPERASQSADCFYSNRDF